MTLLAELVADLPREPSRAIVMFADRVRANVIVIPNERRPGKPEDYDAITAFALKFCKKYSLPIKTPTKATAGFDFMHGVINEINNARSAILAQAIDTEIDSLLVEYDSGSSESFGLARLNEEEKKTIHEHINRIRTLIEQSDLPDRKKNALFDRLNLLAKEVDAHGTSTDRFFAFVGDLGFAGGKFGKNAKPLFDEVRGLIQAISRARARQEGVSLPPGDEPLRIPAPEAGE